MRESIGGGMLLSIVVVFASLIVLVFVNVLSYSKAYKVKNRIIEIIEKYENYDGEINSDIASEIGESLQNMGYKAGNCKDSSNSNLNKSGYKYCVYKIENTSDVSGRENTYYYKVVTYVEFNFPVINSLFEYPVKGETKILGVNYNYE